MMTIVCYGHATGGRQESSEKRLFFFSAARIGKYGLVLIVSRTLLYCNTRPFGTYCVSVGGIRKELRNERHEIL